MEATDSLFLERVKSLPFVEHSSNKDWVVSPKSHPFWAFPWLIKRKVCLDYAHSPSCLSCPWSSLGIFVAFTIIVKGFTTDLRRRLDEASDELLKVRDEVRKSLDELAEKEAQWAALEARIEEESKKAASKIVFDVGGTRFATSKSTLLRIKGTYFEALISSGRLPVLFLLLNFILTEMHFLVIYEGFIEYRDIPFCVSLIILQALKVLRQRAHTIIW